MTYPTNKVNGLVKSGTNLTGTQNFFVINTVIALADNTNFGTTPNAGRNLDQLVRYFAMAAFPAMISVSNLPAVDLSISGNRTAYGLGTTYNQANTSIYTLKISTEKFGVWGGSAADVAAMLTGINATDPTVPGSLANYLDGREVPFATTVPGNATPVTAINTSDAVLKNTVVTFFDLL